MAIFTSKIVPMSKRRFELVPVDRIRVLNSRSRDKMQFDDNIRSIRTVGLLKPIVVNDRRLGSSGYYELVCGEGRYLAHRTLNRDMIAAEVITCTRKTALLFSLVENIARVTPNSIWFAQEMRRMKECGLSIRQISQIVGKDETYVGNYIQLVQMGEERLIKGVEGGLFSIAFAIIVAKSSTDTIQQVLMDAFASGLVTSQNATRVRNLLEQRMTRRKQPDRRESRRPPYSLKDLKRDIGEATKEKEGFVRETTTKERHLLTLLDGLDTLWQDDPFVELLRTEGLVERPKLDGAYSRASAREGAA